MSINIIFAHHKISKEESMYCSLYRNSFAVILFLSLIFGISGDLSAQFIDNQNPIPFIMESGGLSEPWDDIEIRDGIYQFGEPYVDINNNGYWDANNFMQDKCTIKRKLIYFGFTCTDDSIVDLVNDADVLYRMEYKYFNPFAGEKGEWSEWSTQNYAIIDVTVGQHTPNKYTFKVKAKDPFGNETPDSLEAKADIYLSVYRAGIINLVSQQTLVSYNAGWTPNALVGMTLNPNIEQGNTFSVVSNTSSSLIVDNTKMDLHKVSKPGDNFWLIFYKISPPQLRIVDVDGPTGNGMEISLAWSGIGTPVNSVNSDIIYDVYRDGAHLITTTGTSYIDLNGGAGLVNGQEYEYYVIGYSNIYGFESGKSNVVRAAPLATAAAYRSNDVLEVHPDQISMGYTLNTESFTISNKQKNDRLKFSIYPEYANGAIVTYNKLRATDIFTSSDGTVSTIIDRYSNFKPDSLIGYTCTVNERFADLAGGSQPSSGEPWSFKHSGNTLFNPPDPFSGTVMDVDYNGNGMPEANQYMIIGNTKTTLTVLGDATNIGGAGGGGTGSYFGISESLRHTAITFDKVYGEVQENSEKVTLTIDRKRLKGGMSTSNQDGFLIRFYVKNTGRNLEHVVNVSIQEGTRVAIEERSGFVYNYTNSWIDIRNNYSNNFSNIIDWSEYNPNLFQGCFVDPDLSELPYVRSGACPLNPVPWGSNWCMRNGNTPFNYLITRHQLLMNAPGPRTIITVEIPESDLIDMDDRAYPTSFGMAYDRRIFPDPNRICETASVRLNAFGDPQQIIEFPNQYDPNFPPGNGAGSAGYISTSYSDTYDVWVFAADGANVYRTRNNSVLVNPWIDAARGPVPSCYNNAIVTYIWDRKIYNTLQELADDYPRSRLVDTDPDFPPPEEEVGTNSMGICEDEEDLENAGEFLQDFNGNDEFDKSLYWNLAFYPNASDLEQEEHFPVAHVYPPETLLDDETVWEPGERIIVDNDCDCEPDDLNQDGVLDDLDGSYQVDYQHYSIGDFATSDNEWNPPTPWNDLNGNCMYDMVPVIQINADLSNSPLGNNYISPNNTLDSYIIYDADGDNSLPYQEEYIDSNENERYDLGEDFADTNGNGEWDLVAYHYGDRRFHISPSSTDIMIGAAIGDTSGKNDCGTQIMPLLHSEGGEPINELEEFGNKNAGVLEVWSVFPGNSGDDIYPKDYDENDNGSWDSGYLDGILETRTLYTVLEPGDIVQMNLNLVNYTQVQATSLAIIVAEYDPYVSILGPNVVTVDNVPPMSIITTDPDVNRDGVVGPAITFSISEGTPCIPTGYNVPFHVKIVDSRAMSTISSLDREALNLYDTVINVRVVRAGPIEFIPGEIDDDNNGWSRGNGNGIVDEGDKRIELSVKLRNEGCETFGAAAEPVEMTLTIDPDSARWINFRDDRENVKYFSQMDPGEELLPSTNISGQEPDFEFELDPDYDGSPLQFNLSVSGSVTFGSAPPTHAVYMSSCRYTFTRNFTLNPNIKKLKFYKLASGQVDKLYDDRLIDIDARFTPGSLAGLELNPNLDQGTASPILFDIIDNSETTIYVITDTIGMTGVGKDPDYDDDGDYYAVMNPLPPDVFRESETVYIELEGEPNAQSYFNFYNITYPDDAVNFPEKRNRKFFDYNRVMYDDGNHLDRMQGDGWFGGFYTFRDGDDGEFTVLGALTRGRFTSEVYAEKLLLVDTTKPEKPEDLSAEMVSLGQGYIRLDWKINDEFDVQFCESAEYEIYRSIVPYDFINQGVKIDTIRYEPLNALGLQQNQPYYAGPGETYYDQNGNGQWDRGEPFDQLGGTLDWDDGPYFDDTNFTILDYGLTYYYVVRAVDVFNNPSEFSNVAAVTLTNYDPNNLAEIDNLPNDWEYRYGLMEPGAPDIDNDLEDPDNDGLTNYEEFMFTFTNPLKADTDYSGEVDGSEYDGDLAYVRILNPLDGYRTTRVVSYAAIDGRNDTILADVVPGSQHGVFTSTSSELNPVGNPEDNVLNNIYANWKKHAFKGKTLYMGRGTKFIIRDNTETSITVTGEPFDDINGNGILDNNEPFRDVDGDGLWNTDAHLIQLFPDEIGRYWIEGENKVDVTTQIVAEVSSAAGVDPETIEMEVNGALVDEVNDLTVVESFTKQYGNLLSGLIEECYVAYEDDRETGLIDQLTGTGNLAKDGGGPVLATISPDNTTFGDIRGVAVDPFNRMIWVLDAGNNRVVKFSQTTINDTINEVVSIIGFSEPQAIAVDRNTGTCWVADTGNSRIVRLEWDIESYATARQYLLNLNTGGHNVNSSSFVHPVDLAVNQYPYPGSEAGTCWVTDAGNNGLFKIDPSNNIILTRVWGFNNPKDIDLDLYPGYIWVADTDSNRVVMISPYIPNDTMVNSNSGNYHLSLTGLNRPEAVAVNWVDKTVWIADTMHDKVIHAEYDQDLGIIKVKNTITGFYEPFDLAINHYKDLDGNEGNCWVTDREISSQGRLVLLNAKTIEDLETASIDAGGIATIFDEYINPKAVFVNDSSAEVGYRLTYTPPNPFEVETNVSVTITAKTLGVKTKYALPTRYPNATDAKIIVDSFDFTTIQRDTDEPIVDVNNQTTPLTPGMNETDVSSKTIIQFYVYDKTTDVNKDSIKLFVGADEYKQLQKTAYYETDKGDGYIVKWENPLSNFSVNKKYDVRIEAEDLASTPNKMVFKYSFTTEGESPKAPPYIWWNSGFLNPARNANLSSAYVGTISCTILDAGSDVDPETIEMRIIFGNNVINVEDSPSFQIQRNTSGVSLGLGQGYDIIYNMGEQNPFPVGGVTVCVYACDDTGETYVDRNENGFYDEGEDYIDLDKDGIKDPNETYTDENGNGMYDSHSEPFTDLNGNGIKDDLEPYIDENGNDQYDYVAGEEYTDVNGNHQWDPPNCMDPGVNPDSCWSFNILPDTIPPFFSGFNPANGQGRIDPTDQNFVLEFLATDNESGIKQSTAQMTLYIESIYNTQTKEYSVTENPSTGITSSPVIGTSQYRFTLYGYMLNIDYNSRITIELTVQDRSGNIARFSGWSFTTLDKSPPKFGVTSPKCGFGEISGIDMSSDIVVQVLEQNLGDTGIDYNTSYIEVTWETSDYIVPLRKMFSEHVADPLLVITEPSKGDVRIRFNPRNAIFWGPDKSVTYKVCAFDLEGNDIDNCIECNFRTKPGFPEIRVNTQSLSYDRTCMQGYGPPFERSQGFEISNVGLRELRIIEITSDNPENFSVGPYDQRVPIDGSIIVDITYHPVNYGAASGTITIRSDDLERNEIGIRVSGDAGLPPVISRAGFGFNEQVYTKVSESTGGQVAIIVEAYDPNIAGPTRTPDTPPTPTSDTPGPTGTPGPTPSQDLDVNSEQLDVQGQSPDDIPAGRVNAMMLPAFNNVNNIEVTSGTLGFLNPGKDTFLLVVNPTDVRQWMKIGGGIPEAAYPKAGGECAFAADIAGGRIFCVDSASTQQAEYDDVRVYYRGGSWESLGASGVYPNNINGEAVFDSQGNRLLFFGGNFWDGNQTVYLNDVYALDIDSNTWSQIQTTGSTPPGRSGFSMIYRDIGDGGIVVIYGGQTATGIASDCYYLNLRNNAWSQGPQSANIAADASTTWDSDNDRMLVFGGSNGSALLNSFQVLDFNTDSWVNANLVGDTPQLTKNATAVYLAGENSMVVFGGEVSDPMNPMGTTSISNQVLKFDFAVSPFQAPQTSFESPVKRIDVYLDGRFMPDLQPKDDGTNGDWFPDNGTYVYVWNVSPGELTAGEHILSMRAIDNFCEYESTEWPYAVLQSSRTEPGTPGSPSLLLDTHSEIYFDFPYADSEWDIESAPAQSDYPLNLAGGIAYFESTTAIPGQSGNMLTVLVMAKYLKLGCTQINDLGMWIKDITGGALMEEYMGDEWRLTKHPDPVQNAKCWYYVSRAFEEMPGTYLLIIQGENLDGTPSNRYPFLTVDP